METDGYGIPFEMYEGLLEFYKTHDPGKDRVWICEHREQNLAASLYMRYGFKLTEEKLIDQVFIH